MIKNLQILRAFAAINVVLFHIIQTAASYSMNTSWLNLLVGWGANGVDLFFVISGFVMFHTQHYQSSKPVLFFIKRLIRIVPLYWLLTLFVCVLYLLLPNMFRDMQISGGWAFSSFAFVSLLFFDKQPVVYVGWTLELEVLFYLAFALALMVKTSRTQLILLSIAFVFSLMLSKHLIMMEFLFGICAAYIYHYHRLYSGKGWLLFSFGSILLLLTLQPQFRMLSEDLGMQRVVFWGIPAFCVVLGLSLIRQFSCRWLEYLGDASYSIYLVQMLSIPVFYKLASQILHTLNSDLLALYCLIFSVLCGAFVHSLIEKPLTLRCQRMITNGK